MALNCPSLKLCRAWSHQCRHLRQQSRPRLLLPQKSGQHRKVLGSERHAKEVGDSYEGHSHSSPNELKRFNKSGVPTKPVPSVSNEQKVCKESGEHCRAISSQNVFGPKALLQSSQETFAMHGSQHTPSVDCERAAMGAPTGPKNNVTPQRWAASKH